VPSWARPQDPSLRRQDPNTAKSSRLASRAIVQYLELGDGSMEAGHVAAHQTNVDQLPLV
jgi:hypothetical protein